MEEQKRLVLGWREWVGLPELGINTIKAKVDTGAKTSALHAFSVETYDDSGVEMVRFKIHPLRKRNDIIIVCDAPVFDRRKVKDSGGRQEERITIETPIHLGDRVFSAHVTLTSREDMLFRMLLGRRTINAANAMVDVTRSYALGRVRAKQYKDYYPQIQQVQRDKKN